MNDARAMWLDAAAELGIEVVALAQIVLNGQPAIFTALIRQLGGPAGMIVDPSWLALEPHVDALAAAGFGYSCVELGDADQRGLVEVLRDWTWTDPDSSKPRWL